MMFQPVKTEDGEREVILDVNSDLTDGRQSEEQQGAWSSVLIDLTEEPESDKEALLADAVTDPVGSSSKQQLDHMPGPWYVPCVDLTDNSTSPVPSPEQTKTLQGAGKIKLETDTKANHLNSAESVNLVELEEVLHQEMDNQQKDEDESDPANLSSTGKVTKVKPSSQEMGDQVDKCVSDLDNFTSTATDAELEKPSCQKMGDQVGKRESDLDIIDFNGEITVSKCEKPSSQEMGDQVDKNASDFDNLHSTVTIVELDQPSHQDISDQVKKCEPDNINSTVPVVVLEKSSCHKIGDHNYSASETSNTNSTVTIVQLEESSQQEIGDQVDGTKSELNSTVTIPVVELEEPEIGDQVDENESERNSTVTIVELEKPEIGDLDENESKLNSTVTVVELEEPEIGNQVDGTKSELNFTVTLVELEEPEIGDQVDETKSEHNSTATVVELEEPEIGDQVGENESELNSTVTLVKLVNPLHQKMTKQYNRKSDTSNIKSTVIIVDVEKPSSQEIAKEGSKTCNINSTIIVNVEEPSCQEMGTENSSGSNIDNNDSTVNIVKLEQQSSQEISTQDNIESNIDNNDSIVNIVKLEQQSSQEISTQDNSESNTSNNDSTVNIDASSQRDISEDISESESDFHLFWIGDEESKNTDSKINTEPSTNTPEEALQSVGVEKLSMSVSQIEDDLVLPELDQVREELLCEGGQVLSDDSDLEVVLVEDTSDEENAIERLRERKYGGSWTSPKGSDQRGRESGNVEGNHKVKAEKLISECDSDASTIEYYESPSSIVLKSNNCTSQSSCEYSLFETEDNGEVEHDISNTIEEVVSFPKTLEQEIAEPLNVANVSLKQSEGQESSLQTPPNQSNKVMRHSLIDETSNMKDSTSKKLISECDSDASTIEYYESPSSIVFKSNCTSQSNCEYSLCVTEDNGEVEIDILNTIEEVVPLKETTTNEVNSVPKTLEQEIAEPVNVSNVSLKQSKSHESSLHTPANQSCKVMRLSLKGETSNMNAGTSNKRRHSFEEDGTNKRINHSKNLQNAKKRNSLIAIKTTAFVDKVDPPVKNIKRKYSKVDTADTVTQNIKKTKSVPPAEQITKPIKTSKSITDNLQTRTVENKKVSKQIKKEKLNDNSKSGANVTSQHTKKSSEFLNTTSDKKKNSLKRTKIEHPTPQIENADKVSLNNNKYCKKRKYQVETVADHHSSPIQDYSVIQHDRTEYNKGILHHRREQQHRALSNWNVTTVVDKTQLRLQQRRLKSWRAYNKWCDKCIPIRRETTSEKLRRLKRLSKALKYWQSDASEKRENFKVRQCRLQRQRRALSLWNVTEALERRQESSGVQSNAVRTEMRFNNRHDGTFHGNKMKPVEERQRKANKQDLRNVTVKEDTPGPSSADSVSTVSTKTPPPSSVAKVHFQQQVQKQKKKDGGTAVPARLPSAILKQLPKWPIMPVQPGSVTFTKPAKPTQRLKLMKPD